MTTVDAPAEFIEAELDLPIRYIDRSRNYYLSLGYNNPYSWAHNTEVPFTPMTKPVREARIAIVTTAAPTGRKWATRVHGRRITPRRSSLAFIRRPLSRHRTSASLMLDTIESTPRRRM